MTPATLRTLAIQAAGRGEWVKAADLQGQAADLETAARYGRDPYNAGPRSARPVDPVSPNTSPEQRAAAERMLAGSRLTLET